MIGTLEEGELRTLEAWRVHLGASAIELSSLVDKAILRRLDSAYRLSFVGIFALERSSWYCRPQLDGIADTSDILQEIDRIGRLLELYEARASGRDASRTAFAEQLFTDPAARGRVREIDLLSGLFEWTQSYGFHEEEETFRRSGSYRRIDWSATISRNLPHPTRTGVVFADPISITASKTLSNIGVLQAQALVALFDKYQEVARRPFGYASELIAQGRAIVESNTSSISAIEDFLWDQFNSTNRDHDKDLIRLLLAHFALETSGLADIGSIKLFGTVAFHLIWEDICRAAFNSLSSDTDFSNPLYSVHGKDFRTDAQRPDIVLNINGSVFILDAKYYPTFPKSFPALEDVRKQVFYGISARSPVAGLAFLFPGHTDQLAERIGSVAMVSKSGAKSNFPKVICLRVDWRTLVDSYFLRQPVLGLEETVVKAIETGS